MVAISSTTGSGACSVDDDELGEEGVDANLKSLETCREESSSCGMRRLAVA